MTHPASIHPPLLRHGDGMSLDEFLNRWDQMPDLKFAELVEGLVYMPSPVSHNHGRIDSRIQGLCALYCFRTPGSAAMTNATWLMPPSGAPQPDCSIQILPEYGGRSTIKNGLSSGAPEFVAEIVYSSRAYDLGPKLALYQVARVDEYLAILVEERRFEWRWLVNGSYQILESLSGVYRSRVFPGLWINEAAFWNEDSAALVQTLEYGLASQEQTDFVSRLGAKG